METRPGKGYGKAAHLRWVALQADAQVPPERAVSLEELLAHGASHDDPWTCIGGSVYSLREYLEYHPGGKKELLKGAGIDSTELFARVHRWVNYGALMRSVRVGPLAEGNPRVEEASAGLSADEGEATPFASSEWQAVTLQWRRASSGGGGLLYRFDLPPGCSLYDASRPSVGRPLEMRAMREAPSPLRVFPASPPSAVGYFDLVVAPALPEFAPLAAVRPGSTVWVRRARAADGVRTLGEEGRGRASGRLRDEEAQGEVDAGAFAVFPSARSQWRSTPDGVKGQWSAAWPGGGVCSPFLGILCIARGDGLAPLLPLLDWAADARKCPVWLLWEAEEGASLESPLLRPLLELVERGGGAGLRVAVQGHAGPRSSVADVLSEPAGAGGGVCTAHLQELVRSGWCPAPHHELLVVVCGGAGGRGWVRGVDEALRGAYYLAANVVEVSAEAHHLMGPPPPP